MTHNAFSAVDTPPSTPEISWRSSRVDPYGLRMRFRPRVRMRLMLFRVAPWIDCVLLVAAFLFIVRGGSLRPGVVSGVLTPGIGVDLPKAPFAEGSEATLFLVVNRKQVPAQPMDAAPTSPSDGATAPGAAAPPAAGILVFFDERLYDLSQESGLGALNRAVKERLQPDGETKAILFVDSRVPFGELAGLLTSLRETGVAEVSFATKTP